MAWYTFYESPWHCCMLQKVVHFANFLNKLLNFFSRVFRNKGIGEGRAGRKGKSQAKLLKMKGCPSRVSNGILGKIAIFREGKQCENHRNLLEFRISGLWFRTWTICGFQLGTQTFFRVLNRNRTLFWVAGRKPETFPSSRSKPFSRNPGIFPSSDSDPKNFSEFRVGTWNFRSWCW